MSHVILKSLNKLKSYKMYSSNNTRKYDKFNNILQNSYWVKYETTSEIIK